MYIHTKLQSMQLRAHKIFKIPSRSVINNKGSEKIENG